MKSSLFALLVAAVIAMAMTQPAHAAGICIDPNGLSWWDQFVAWVTGAEADTGACIDPDG